MGDRLRGYPIWRAHRARKVDQTLEAVRQSSS